MNIPFVLRACPIRFSGKNNPGRFRLDADRLVFITSLSFFLLSLLCSPVP